MVASSHRQFVKQIPIRQSNPHQSLKYQAIIAKREARKERLLALRSRIYETEEKDSGVHYLDSNAGSDGEIDQTLIDNDLRDGYLSDMTHVLKENPDKNLAMYILGGTTNARLDVLQYLEIKKPTLERLFIYSIK